LSNCSQQLLVQGGRGLDVRSCYCWQIIATAVSNQQHHHHHQLPLFQLLTRRYHWIHLWVEVEESGGEGKGGKKKLHRDMQFFAPSFDTTNWVFL